MTKNISGVVAVLSLLAFVGSAQAAPAIPERNGTFNDPDHPGVKVRVFVHPERPVRAEASALACNLPDPDSASVIGATGWKLPATWTYNLNPNSVPVSVGGTNLPTIVASGFADWQGAAGNKIVITRGANTTVDRQAYDNRNVIAWGRTSGSALGVTYVRYLPSTGQVIDVDTIMNKKFSWKWSGSNTCADPAAYDAENIMTHELGHWLGLDDEYDAASINNTMYGYGFKGEVKKNTLTTGDIQGTLIIYP